MHRDPPDVTPAAAHYQQASPWPRNSACARCKPTATWVSAPCTHTTGQREQARAALSTAIALYRAMDMVFWLPQAEAALAQVA